jgi:mitochondrial splicing suppressor protein 51
VCARNSAAAFAASDPPTNNPSSFSSSTTNAGNPPKGLSAAINKPFHRLEAQTWLHDRPEQDVYKLLIDTYRFRMEDNYNLEGSADADSIYGGASDSLQGFRRFLRLAQSRPGLLPPWWSPEKAAECEAAGTPGSGWNSLTSAIEKSDVIEHYGDSKFPMQLRMFGEQVYGRGPGGQDGASMRRLMMTMEAGGPEAMHTSQIDISSMLGRV